MPTTGNKRVSQLVELTSGEIQPNDLFLIIDATARESKKIRASELEIYLQGSGSITVNSISSSYVPGSGVNGIVSLANTAYSSSTSLYALLANLATSASFATTASFALSGGNSDSGSISASYLIYVGSPNGTASYSIKSLQSDVATTANFLSYFGGNNGTASYAITTQNVLNAVNAQTASYLSNVGTSVATASYAYVAQTAYSGMSDSSSYLIFSPNNGTASYAMSAQKFANVVTDQGIFLAISQSNIKAQLDDVDILWSTTATARTPIEAFGTIKIPFTSSAVTNGTLYLSVIDRNTGFETILDSTPITFNLSPSMGTYGNNDSGSVRQTFSLLGQANLYGSYLIFVSASNNLQIESTRIVKFNIASESDVVSTYSNVPIIFSSDTTSSIFTFTSTDGGPFNDSYVGINVTQSLGKQIFTLNGVGQNIGAINYFWLLNSVTASNISNNPLFTVSGIPNSLTYFSCSNCNLSSFYSFTSSSLSVLDFHNNFLTKMPNLPISMSYINGANNSLTSLNLPLSLSYLNCSNNSLTNLPTTMPSGLQTIVADFNNISTLSTMPNTTVSMSFNNNGPLTTILSLPTNLQYFSINQCNVNSLPAIPTNVIYLSAYSCSFLPVNIDNITSDLVFNAQISGTLDIRGSGIPDLISTSNITVLQSNGWTVYYD